MPTLFQRGDVYSEDRIQGEVICIFTISGRLVMGAYFYLNVLGSDNK